MRAAEPPLNALRPPLAGQAARAAAPSQGIAAVAPAWRTMAPDNSVFSVAGDYFYCHVKFIILP